MGKTLSLLLLIFGLIFTQSVYAKPTPPSRPTPPPVPVNNQVAPEPPEESGDYEVPGRPGLRVRVFAHPPRPTPPPKPGTTPAPTPTPTPAPSENSSLICGLNDPDSATSVGSAGWHLPGGNWTYQLNLSSVPSSVGGSNLATIASNSFSQYSSVLGTAITPIRGVDTTVSRSRLDGRNAIAWGRLSGGTLAVANIWYYPSTGLVAESDITMNTRYRWSWSNSNSCADDKTYDAQNIMTHEVGHWFGLNDEYNASLFQNNTMYGYGLQGEVKKNTLTAGDISGLNSIYNP